MIVALYVAEDGPYATDPRVDAWGVTRDARLYAGDLPAVTHPECKRWGRMAKGSPSSQRFEVGDDGGMFAHALETVRRVGGTIEHPQGSHAWRTFDLPIPKGKGWTPADLYGGRSCYIDQGAYGHPAKKPTWLYAVLPVFPEMRWERVWDRPRIGGDGFHSKAERAKAKARVGGFKKSPQVESRWRWQTPDALKDQLIAMAESCHGWRPAPRARQAVIA